MSCCWLQRRFMIICPPICSPPWNPSRVSLITISARMSNKYVERTQPCRTPFLTRNHSDSVPATLTLASCFLYSLASKSIKCRGCPMSIIVTQSLSWEIESGFDSRVKTVNISTLILIKPYQTTQHIIPTESISLSAFQCSFCTSSSAAVWIVLLKRLVQTFRSSRCWSSTNSLRAFTNYRNIVTHKQSRQMKTDYCIKTTNVCSNLTTCQKKLR